jgi:hypothetical protein
MLERIQPTFAEMKFSALPEGHNTSTSKRATRANFLRACTLAHGSNIARDVETAAFDVERV